MKNSKQTILIISPSFSPVSGGLETHLDDLCAYLKRRDYCIYVITYQYLEKKAKIVEGSNPKIIRIPWFSYNLLFKLEQYPLLYFMYLAPTLLAMSLLFMLRHRHEVNIVHAHGLVTAVIAALLKKIFKKRTIVSLHTIYHLNRRSKLLNFGKIWSEFGPR